MTDYKKCEITHFSENDSSLHIYRCASHDRVIAFYLDTYTPEFIDEHQQDFIEALNCPREPAKITQKNLSDYNDLRMKNGEKPINLEEHKIV